MGKSTTSHVASRRRPIRSREIPTHGWIANGGRCGRVRASGKTLSDQPVVFFVALRRPVFPQVEIVAVDANDGLAAAFVATVRRDLSRSSGHLTTRFGSFFRRTTEKCEPLSRLTPEGMAS